MSEDKKSKMEAKDWIIITLGIIILLLGIGCGVYYHKYQKAEGQVVIWNDSAYIYKNKYGEEYAAKNTYILQVDQLKKYNEELYAEYQSLKDHPVVITKTVIVTKIDSVEQIHMVLNTMDNYYLGVGMLAIKTIIKLPENQLQILKIRILHKHLQIVYK